MLSTARLLCLLLLAALAGCAGHLPVPPLAGADGRLVPPDLAFTLRDGTMLPARVWLPPVGVAPRGVILALHGFDDSRDAWELPAPRFTAAGYIFYAPDQRGFGATATRGRWAGTETLVSDAAELREQLHARHPGLPVTIMGESMGGAIALVLAARPDTPAGDSTVLLAPAVWDRAEMGLTLRTGLWLASSITPGWSLTGNEIPLHIQASDNREALLRLAHDPLTLRRTRFDVLRGLVDLMGDAAHAAPSLHGSVLVLDGQRDQIVPPAATAKLWGELPPAIRRGYYPAGYHLLLRDKDRERVDDDVLAWLAAPGGWLPSGADITAGAWYASRSWQDQPGVWLPNYALDGAFAPFDRPF